MHQISWNKVLRLIYLVQCNNLLYKETKMTLKNMPMLILMLLLFPSVSWAEKHCDESKRGDNYKTGLETIDGEEIINLKGALFPEGKIKCEINADYFKPTANKTQRVEVGALNGVKYRIFYSDGSGTIQGLPNSTLDYGTGSYDDHWSIGCKLDEMDDSHWCYIKKKDLMVGLWKDGKAFVSIGSDHYPSSQVTIRVDKLQPISAPEKIGFSNEQVTAIIGQLSKGSSALTRYQEWPYKSNIDKPIDLYGFSQALQILKKVHTSI